METSVVKLVILSKIVGIVMFSVQVLLLIWGLRKFAMAIFRKEFDRIHEEVFEKGNIAVAIYAGLVIGLIALGLIYAFTNFLL